MDSFNKAVLFIDQFSLDDQLYWQIRESGHLKVEVMFDRSDAKRAWQLKRPDDQSWHFFSCDDFIEVCRNEDLPVNLIVSEIATTALSQTVFAELFITKANETFGEKAVIHASQAAKGFMNQLRGLIESHRRKQESVSKRDLRVIDGFRGEA